MPYTAAHGKITFLGDSYATTEIWQTTLRLIGTAVPTQQQLQDAAGAMSILLENTALAFPLGFRFLGVKWAPQDTAGEYGPDGEAVEYFLPTPVTGSASNGYPQIACVLSLRTARARGYASNGRMYIPSARAPAPADGLITQAQAESIRDSGAAFIANVETSGVGVPAVMSTVGAGRTEAITAVRVGRVMDTQRRRRNQLPELYTTEADVPT